MAKIAVVMGSGSDWESMKPACEMLESFGVAWEARVLSAHRMPDEMFAFAENARANGFAAIIAGAGGAAHLPGMLAAKTTLPVLGVPVPVGALRGQDALYSIVQMPRGVPVATFAIGGAANAALFALRMLGVNDPSIAQALERFRALQREKAMETILPPLQETPA